MSKHDARPEAYLADMVDYAELILQFTQGLTEEQYSANLEKRLAVERCFEVMGEAASRVDEQTRAKFPLVPFGKIKGMRNLLIHDYRNVINKVVWRTVQHHLKAVIAELKPTVEQHIRDERARDEAGSGE